MIPKFRAWDKRFSEFVEDFFVSEDGKIYQKTKDTGYGFAISRETSDKVILMQSTGLKDKNGKEIFEGDILSDEGSELEDEWVYVSVINKDGMCYCLENEIHGVSGALIDFVPYYSVEGNIYENPELLK